MIRVIAVLVVLFATPLRAQELIQERLDRTEVPEEIAALLAQVTEGRGAALAEVVTLDVASLTLPRLVLRTGGEEGQALTLVAETILDGFGDALPPEDLQDFTWMGRVVENAAPSFFYVGEEGAVSGMVWQGATLYEILPLDGDLHALIELPEPDLLPDDTILDNDEPPPPDEEIELEPLPEGQEQGIIDDDGFGDDLLPLDDARTIRVLIIFSAAAAERYPNVTNQANLMIGSANTVLATNRIDGRFQLAGAYASSYREITPIWNEWAALRGRSDGRLDDVHDYRDSLQADLVYLVSIRTDKAGWARHAVNDSWGFGVVHGPSAVATLTFIHEVGHNLGACHDRAAAGGCQPMRSYGWGHADQGSGQSSIMAYARSCAPPCTRIPRFTQPGVIGTSSTLHDVRRLVSERIPDISGFR